MLIYTVMRRRVQGNLRCLWLLALIDADCTRDHLRLLVQDHHPACGAYTSTADVASGFIGNTGTISLVIGGSEISDIKTMAAHL